MTFEHIQSKEFLVGAALGSLLGGVAAVLAAPRSGGQLRQAMSDVCHTMSDRASDMMQKGKCLVKNRGSSSSDWADLAKSFLGRVKGLKEDVIDEEGDTVKDLLIGVAVGSVFGAMAGLMLAPKAGSEMREELSDRAQDFIDKMSKKGKDFAQHAGLKTNNWLDFARQMIEKFSEEVGEKKEYLKEGAKQHLAEGRDRLDDIQDWIHLGTRLWKTFKDNR